MLSFLENNFILVKFLNAQSKTFIVSSFLSFTLSKPLNIAINLLLDFFAVAASEKPDISV